MVLPTLEFLYSLDMESLKELMVSTAIQVKAPEKTASKALGSRCVFFLFVAMMLFLVFCRSADHLTEARKVLDRARRANDLRGFAKVEQLYLLAAKEHKDNAMVLIEIGNFYADYSRLLTNRTMYTGSGEPARLAKEKSLASKPFFDNAILLDPRNLQGYMGLANFYLYGAGESPTEAVKIFQKLEEVLPPQEVPWQDMSMAYMAMKDRENAIKCLETALKYARESKDELFIRKVQEWLGRAYALQGEIKKAEDDEKTYQKLKKEFEKNISKN